MTEQPPQLQVALEPVTFALKSLIDYDEENYFVVLVSGNQGRRYQLSPKHAKRLLFLLQQKIEAYQKQFGELKTELPKAIGQGSNEKKIGFQASKEN